MTADVYLAQLDELNWFANVPDERAAEQRTAVTEAFARGSKMPYINLSDHAFDCEMIYGCGPDEPLSYHGLITELAAVSGGAFDPTNIVDVADENAEVFRVSFDHGGKSYEFEAELTDWVDADLYRAINRALAESDTPVRMYELDVPDQCVFCVFRAPAVLDAASDRGLVRAHLAGTGGED